MTFRFPCFRCQPTKGADGTSRRAWRTGFWRRAPISGMLALITAILCGIATIAVLRASDGLPINSWRIAGYTVQPTVLLSILATLANALFRYAFTEGVKISWWVQAQQGASIEALHRSWDHAQSALPITTAGRDVTLNAVASFFVLMLLIDGPFFQRASSIGVITRHHSTQLKANVSPSPFMLGATGIFADHDDEYNPTLLNPVYSEILQQYNNREPINLPEFGCKGRCELELTAPGWDLECNRWTSPYRLMNTADLEQYSQAYSHNKSYSGPAIEQTMFWNNVTYGSAASDMWYELYRYRTGSLPPGVSNSGHGYHPRAFPFNTILLSSMRKSTTGRNGTLDWRYCILREAVQTYPVIVTNKTVTIPRRNLDHNSTVYKIIRKQETSGPASQPSTLGGLWLSLLQTFSGSAKMNYIFEWDAVRTSSSSGQVYIDVANATILNTEDVKWNDPIDDMISMIQELSLRTAIRTTSVPPQLPATSVRSALPEPEQIKEEQAELTAIQYHILSPNLTSIHRPLHQTVHTTMRYEETVYQSHYDWMIGALTVILIAFCSIIPTFYGWWHLGRTVSLSPVETAKAFDAPLLRQVDPNGTARDISIQLRSTYVRYGASLPLDAEEQHDAGYQHNDDDRAKDASAVEILENSATTFARNHLHFGREGTVTRPSYGQTFSADEAEMPNDSRITAYSGLTYVDPT